MKNLKESGSLFNSIFKLSDDFPYRIIEEEMLLVNQNKRNVLHLNKMATWFLTALDGKKTLEEVVKQTLDEYEIDEQTIRNDLQKIILELYDEGVVVTVL